MADEDLDRDGGGGLPDRHHNDISYERSLTLPITAHADTALSQRRFALQALIDFEAVTITTYRRDFP
ncbi:hypothetical protein GGQ85_001266 [Nitrobacter vulgaris]|uniref:hypothetical protein n=1 Tax=Nitrobacter vulgaris TaxID=29421 RepID=UPI00285DA2AC|nr:hypothetical protein [Nitrobacter vulgaris]MDR6303576.1 hypothetical protein [Nitrobacter vulgaris]